MRRKGYGQGRYKTGIALALIGLFLLGVLAAGKLPKEVGIPGDISQREPALKAGSEGGELKVPLIQATTLKEEYEGLVHLNLLASPENYSGDIAQSIRNVLPTVVRIRTGEYLGSGIILQIDENSLLIASNRHQLQSRDFSSVTLYNGEEASGRLVFLSENYDLGFLEVDITRIPYEKREELRSIVCSMDCEEALRQGDAMFFVGSADGVACNIAEGKIGDPWYYFDEFASYMIYNYCKAKAGMSGGGTYDEHGHCIGMITGGLADETASLPMKSIREEWERYAGGE